MPSKIYLKYTFFICYFFIFLGYSKFSLAQSAKPGINFQAVARDKEHNSANNRKIYVKCTIENGTSNPIIVYGENHNTNTNEFGIFNIVIGKGTQFTGANDIYSIDWANGKYFFHLKVAITPISPDLNWDYNNEWIDLGAVEFGVVPYAIQSLSSSMVSTDTASMNTKLNIADTTKMLLPYHKAIFVGDSTKYITPFQFASKSYDTSYLSNRINLKLNIIDTADMLNNRFGKDTMALSNRINLKLNIIDTAGMLNNRFKRDTFSLSNRINLKLNIVDTLIMLNNRIGRDTLALSNRINYKEDFINKSVDVSLVGDFNDTKYPSVKAIKSYVDAALIAGAPDATNTNKGIILLAGDLTGTASIPIVANNAITTNKLLDASVTDAKISSGISSLKVGLGNVTNNAQLYNLNGLTSQVQNFTTPGTMGLNPGWVSTGTNHILNIPLASASSVTAGLISKIDYDQFTIAYNNRVNSITNVGNNGVATFNSNVLNIPAYSLVGLAGNVNPNMVFSGPASGAAGPTSFRALVSADIPNNAANTSGNANTASTLQTPRYLNNALFDGSVDVTNITANTTQLLSFSNTGLGAASGSTFNGSVVKEVSYNTIGAAPSIGSTSITTLGNISTGSWSANVIGSNYGGAGTNNGILKANGAGLVSVATSGTDFIAPFGSQTAKYIYAAPNALNGIPIFRALEASDIPLLNQNTTGNSNTATSLATAVNINGVSFNGTANITITANTSNGITFDNSGSGLASSTFFNGAAAKTISYNTIGAAPTIGSSSITTLGTISTGTWAANIIGANYGGAGSNNGILKANGSGIVSVATAGTDFQTPLSFSRPLWNIGNAISILQASNVVDGYLSSTDWINFNNKIDLTQKAANNGVASLDANGKIPNSQIPSISFSSGYVVTSQAAMLGLSAAVVGSIAIRTDNSKNYVLSGLPATTLSNWLELLMPASVSSVNGYTASNITLTSTDIAEGTNLYYTDARAKNAISTTSPLTYNASTGLISIPAATSSVPGYLTSSDWTMFNSKIGAFTAQAANSIYAGPTTGVNALPTFRSIVVTDIPTLNQNTTGNAGTATKLAATKNINGVAFDGSADIIISSTIPNAVTFNSGGSGGTSPTSFDGSLAKTISYNTIGASPLIGSSSLTTVGTITTGTWAGNVIAETKGGAGVVNGVLKADGSGNVSAAVGGTDFIAPFTSQTSKYFYAAPNAANGVPVFRSILASDIPILNQNTTGNAATATKLAASININGVAFDGSSNITISSNITNAVTFNNSGSGVTSPVSFDGSLAKTISYNTIGASPLIGSSSLTTVGSITAGTWLGTVIDASHGGAGNVNGILKANGLGVVSAATAGTDFENSLSFSLPLTRSANTISLSAATTSSNGYLTSTDWNLFNGKQATILGGTGVSITGGNTIVIGQTVASSASPTFVGLNLSGLNVAGVVTNTAGGILGTAATTGSGNIVRSTSPTLVTPILGDATATTLIASGDITAKRFKLTMPTAITAAASTTIDLSTGNVFTVNMGLNITSLTLNNPVVGTYLIKFVQDATGTRDATFPIAWKWASGVIPSLTNTATKLDIVTLIYDGTSYYATIVQNF